MLIRMERQRDGFFTGVSGCVSSSLRAGSAKGGSGSSGVSGCVFSVCSDMAIIILPFKAVIFFVLAAGETRLYKLMSFFASGQTIIKATILPTAMPMIAVTIAPPGKYKAIAYVTMPLSTAAINPLIIALPT